MLTKLERKLVAKRSAEWVGPACWGLCRDYRLGLRDAMDNLPFA
jgi:hypothetical protein